MIVTDLFKIQDIPRMNGCEWSVSWPGYGLIRTPSTQVTLLNMAFKTNAVTIGIAFDGRFGRVLFLQNYSWLSVKAEELVRYYEMEGITGMAFPELKEAECFVEQAEQAIMWKLLSADHNDD